MYGMCCAGGGHRGTGSNPEYEAPERPCRQDPDDEPAEWCVGCRLAHSLDALNRLEVNQ